MAVVAFWNDGKKETGQTVSIAAIATHLSFFNNYRTLIFDTKHNGSTFKECFWSQGIEKIEFKDKTKTDIATGVSGLAKAIFSNKASPEAIKNYTKTIFAKSKLELLSDKEITKEEYDKQKIVFKEMIKMANKAYDIVLVDLTGELSEPYISGILELSNLIVLTLPQTLRGLNKYVELRKQNDLLTMDKKMVMIGRYDAYSKYNAKNIERHIGEKMIYGIPYNSLFFEACNEGKVADFFIRFNKIKETNVNFYFVDSIEKIAREILAKIEQLKMH